MSDAIQLDDYRPKGRPENDPCHIRFVGFPYFEGSVQKPPLQIVIPASVGQVDDLIQRARSNGGFWGDSDSISDFF